MLKLSLCNHLKNRKIKWYNKTKSLYDAGIVLEDYARMLRDSDIILMLEASASCCGCELWNTLPEVAQLVKEINHPNLKLSVNIKHLKLNNESSELLYDYDDIIGNFRINELCSVVEHNKFSQTLRNIHYDKILTLEPLDNEVDSLIQFIKEIYGV